MTAYGKPIPAMDQRGELKGMWKELTTGHKVLEVNNICHDCDCTAMPLTNSVVQMQNWQTNGVRSFNYGEYGSISWEYNQSIPPGATDNSAIYYTDGGQIWIEATLPVLNYAYGVNFYTFYIESSGMRATPKYVYFYLVNGNNEFLNFTANVFTATEAQLSTTGVGIGYMQQIAVALSTSVRSYAIYVSVTGLTQPREIMVEALPYGDAFLDDTTSIPGARSPTVLYTPNRAFIATQTTAPHVLVAGKFYPRGVRYTFIDYYPDYIAPYLRDLVSAFVPARWNCQSGKSDRTVDYGDWTMYVKYFVFEFKSYRDPDQYLGAGSTTRRLRWARFDRPEMRLKYEGVCQHYFGTPPSGSPNKVAPMVRFDQTMEFEREINFDSAFTTIATGIDTINGVATSTQTAARVRYQYMIVTAEMDWGGTCADVLRSIFPSAARSAYWADMLYNQSGNWTKINTFIYNRLMGYTTTAPAKRAETVQRVSIPLLNTATTTPAGVAQHAFYPERYLHPYSNGTLSSSAQVLDGVDTVSPAVAITRGNDSTRPKAKCNRAFENMSDCQYVTARRNNNWPVGETASTLSGGFESAPLVNCVHPKLAPYTLRESKCNRFFCQYYTPGPKTFFNYGGDNSNSYL